MKITLILNRRSVKSVDDGAGTPLTYDRGGEMVAQNIFTNKYPVKVSKP